MNGYEALLMYTYTIDLTRPLETIWKELDGSCRKTITATSKVKPSIERSHDAKALFDVMRERLAFNEKTFFQSQTPEYLKEMMMIFPDNIKMYSVYVEGKIVAGCVNYEYRKRCTGWMGAPAANDRKDINEYMLWELIKKAREEGFIAYENLGADEKRLNPFKSKFNPSLTPYFYMVKRDGLYRTASNTSEILTKFFSGLHQDRIKASMLAEAPAAGGE
jgi:lipid II:glycine glycyltransferase (peptidoglycan interpeptide bridge formation enzyme)